MKRFNFKRYLAWEWVVCFAVLAMLAAMVLGHDVLGLSGYLTAVMAVVVGLVTTVVTLLITFIMVAFVGPLLALLAGVFAALMAAVGIVVASVILPVVALVTGLFSSLIAWVAGTWLGTLLMPVYNVAAPLILKIAPWITTSKFAAKVWDKVDDHPKVRRVLVRLKVPGYGRKRTRKAK